jgi:hypothetical protein
MTFHSTSEQDLNPRSDTVNDHPSVLSHEMMVIDPGENPTRGIFTMGVLKCTLSKQVSAVNTYQGQTSVRRQKQMTRLQKLRIMGMTSEIWTRLVTMATHT